MQIISKEIEIVTKKYFDNNLLGKYPVAADKPEGSHHTIDVQLPHKTVARFVHEVWYQPIRGIEGINNFGMIDVNLLNEESSFGNPIKVKLSISSIPDSVSKLTIKIFVLYTPISI